MRAKGGGGHARLPSLLLLFYLSFETFFLFALSFIFLLLVLFVPRPALPSCRRCTGLGGVATLGLRWGPAGPAGSTL